jgi:hypothetical protein
MKLLANLVEIGDGPWAAFQRGLLFKFARHLRLCSLLAPHALLVTGWLLAVAADTRLTNGVRLMGCMGQVAATATGVGGDTTAGRLG